MYNQSVMRERSISESSTRLLLNSIDSRNATEILKALDQQPDTPKPRFADRVCAELVERALEHAGNLSSNVLDELNNLCEDLQDFHAALILAVESP